MKLYTEEQLHNTVIAISNYLDDINLERAQQNIEKHLKALKSIELPSDEEIGKLRDIHIPIDEEDMWSERFYFTIGAKAMRDKIQGGKDEQQ